MGYMHRVQPSSFFPSCLPWGYTRREYVQGGACGYVQRLRSGGAGGHVQKVGVERWSGTEWHGKGEMEMGVRAHASWLVQMLTCALVGHCLAWRRAIALKSGSVVRGVGLSASTL